MAIRIREVHFKATVRDNDVQQNSSNTRQTNQGDQDQQAIVAACVEQVMRKLKENAER